MRLLFLFLNPLICGVIGFVLMRLAIRIFFGWKYTRENLKSLLKELVSTRIENFLAKIKIQIPISKMFLQGAMEENLKDQAVEEVVQVIPELEYSVSLPLSILGGIIGICIGIVESFLF